MFLDVFFDKVHPDSSVRITVKLPRLVLSFFPVAISTKRAHSPVVFFVSVCGGGARETGDADTAPLFLGSRARDRERAKNFFIDRHSLSFFLFCDFFSFLFSVVWFGLVWFCSVVEMGLMSRKVLPVCGNMCVCCPALRARSRQPVKRYNMLLAEIYPKNQVWRRAETTNHSYRK